MAQPITWVVQPGEARFQTREPDEAEAECDRRNSGRESPFFACILLELVAQRMGGHQAPTTST